MGPPDFVGLKVVIKYGRHLIDGFKLGVPSLDPEKLVDQGAMKAFKVAVGLRTPHAGGAVGSLLK
jgi:hypothetical protein